MLSTFPQDNGTSPAPQAKVVPLGGTNPDDYLRAMSSSPDAPWHPRNIAARIEAQVARLGVSRTSLLADAKVDEKAVRDLAEGHWPNLRRIVQLAAAFKFPGGIAELLGVQNGADPRCDPRVLHVSLELVAAAMDMRDHENPLITKPHVIAGLASVAHQQLVELRRIDPNALSNAAALHMISVVLRSHLASFDPENE